MEARRETPKYDGTQLFFMHFSSASECTLISFRKTNLDSLKCAVGPSGKFMINRASKKTGI